MQIAFVDHYDSFANNLLAWLEPHVDAANTEIVRVYADDRTGLAELINAPLPLILTPGPGDPRDYPLSQRLLESTWGKAPILGICLGLQMIGLRLGGLIGIDAHAHHGSARTLNVATPAADVFADVSCSFEVATYNSLGFFVNEFPALTAVVAQDQFGLVQALSFNPGAAILAFQFHPESFMTEHSDVLARNVAKIICNVLEA